jgi:hypothetical protein
LYGKCKILSWELWKSNKDLWTDFAKQPRLRSKHSSFTTHSWTSWRR